MAIDIPVHQALRDLQGGRGRAVLIVEPSPDQQARLARLMAVHGHRVVGTSTLDGAHAFLQAFPADLVLLAEELAGDSPLRVVADIVGHRPGARIVIMTRPTGVDAKAGTARQSALEYVPRSFGGDVLQTLLPN
jgi:DNA-binding NtrC family response regulator